MHHLIVINQTTGGQFPVASFHAQGDLFIALNALQTVAPSHLLYEYQGAKPVEWVFDWIGGGWNSVFAASKSEAIQVAQEKYGLSNINISSFRVATPQELKSLLNEIY